MTAAPELEHDLIGNNRLPAADDDPTVSVAEAAQLLGRDRTRVYALLRSGDLVAAPMDPRR